MFFLQSSQPASQSGELAEAGTGIINNQKSQIVKALCSVSKSRAGLDNKHPSDDEGIAEECSRSDPHE